MDRRCGPASISPPDIYGMVNTGTHHVVMRPDDSIDARRIVSVVFQNIDYILLDREDRSDLLELFLNHCRQILEVFACSEIKHQDFFGTVSDNKGPRCAAHELEARHYEERIG